VTTIPTITVGSVPDPANYDSGPPTTPMIGTRSRGRRVRRRFYSAFGEVLDVAQDLGLDRRDPARSGTTLVDDPQAFRRYQRDLSSK
jgi:hypothetical protein